VLRRHLGASTPSVRAVGRCSSTVAEPVDSLAFGGPSVNSRFARLRQMKTPVRLGRLRSHLSERPMDRVG
jgi:hypothetical protein